MELEWGSIFGSHYKTPAGLNTLFISLSCLLILCVLRPGVVGRSESQNQLWLPLILPWSCWCSGWRAANLTQGRVQRQEAVLALMLSYPSNAFSLLLKCIAGQRNGWKVSGLCVGAEWDVAGLQVWYGCPRLDQYIDYFKYHSFFLEPLMAP